MNFLLFPNGSCIEENHCTSLHCFRDAKVFYMLCITTKCVKSQQNYLFKKRYKKAPSIRAQRRSSEKNFLQILLIYIKDVLKYLFVSKYLFVPKYLFICLLSCFYFFFISMHSNCFL